MWVSGGGTHATHFDLLSLGAAIVECRVAVIQSMMSRGAVDALLSNPPSWIAAWRSSADVTMLVKKSAADSALLGCPSGWRPRRGSTCRTKGAVVGPTSLLCNPPRLMGMPRHAMASMTVVGESAHLQLEGAVLRLGTGELRPHRPPRQLEGTRVPLVCLGALTTAAVETLVRLLDALLKFEGTLRCLGALGGSARATCSVARTTTSPGTLRTSRRRRRSAGGWRAEERAARLPRNAWPRFEAASPVVRLAEPRNTVDLMARTWRATPRMRPRPAPGMLALPAAWLAGEAS